MIIINILYYKNAIEKIATETVTMSPYEKRINKIKQSGLNTNLLELSYIDKKKTKTKRLVEPYKLTSDDFWAFDIERNGIRRFKTNNIKGVKITNKTFSPRWDIEI